MMITARQAGMARARSRRRLELEEPERGISENYSMVLSISVARLCLLLLLRR